MPGWLACSRCESSRPQGEAAIDENVAYDRDGARFKTDSYQNGFQVKPDTMLHIGSNYAEDSRSLNGAIQRFQLYDHKFTPQEVAALTALHPQ